ncbi:ferredoxin--NADP reductase, partial [Pseudomonas aeruginosa]|nr:ferredoxin--NADP reductase [Pseudomonas aeruginosa]
QCLVGAEMCIRDRTSAVLDSFGLKISPRMGEPGDYLIERAFVEK